MTVYYSKNLSMGVGRLHISGAISNRKERIVNQLVELLEDSSKLNCIEIHINTNEATNAKDSLIDYLQSIIKQRNKRVKIIENKYQPNDSINKSQAKVATNSQQLINHDISNKKDLVINHLRSINVKSNLTNRNQTQVATNSQQFKTGVASRVDRIQQKMNELQAELDSLKSYIVSYREDDYGNVYEMEAEQGADGSYHVVNERKLNANEIRNLKPEVRSKFKHAKNRY